MGTEKLCYRCNKNSLKDTPFAWCDTCTLESTRRILKGGMAFGYPSRSAFARHALECEGRHASGLTDLEMEELVKLSKTPEPKRRPIPNQRVDEI